MPSKKLKAAAAAPMPQSKEACAQDVALIGELQRNLARLQADMNDAIGKITAQYQPMLELVQTQIDARFKGVHAWCEANRAALTNGGQVKTANLVTGTVSWRAATPSCSVRGEPAVIDTLKALKLTAFIRTSESVNKELIIATTLAAQRITPQEAQEDLRKQATLQAARALETVAGLKVQQGKEAFSVQPFEQQVATA